MSLSTHVLDTARGRPASGVGVRLTRAADGTVLAEGTTDDDGRLRLPGAGTEQGVYRLTFDTGAYLGPDAFFPEVTVVFTITDPRAHHHVPLLLSPYGYSTYRGS